MIVEFEKWLNANLDVLDEDFKGLFTDSIMCFKYDIDRPAYLLAYQGMMSHLREVMRKSKRPDGITEGKWQDKLGKISNDTTWDSFHNA